MAINVIVCGKCGAVIEKDGSDRTMPGLGTCPKGGSHHWTLTCTNVPGNINYQCKYCGVMIRGGSTSPTSGDYCPSGKRGHAWSKL